MPMKKSDFIYKTIQLILFILLAITCLCIVLFDANMRSLIASDPGIRLIYALLGGILGLSFIFICFEFSFLSSCKKDYTQLDHAVYSDPLSGLANRFSCDNMIEKYLDKPLPECLGCIMFDLKVNEINRLYGHIHGNHHIREFADLLKMASTDLCFVGRNGGNKFLALFEEGSQEKIDQFLSRLRQRVQAYNDFPENLPIEYYYGVAFQEGDAAKTITDLIALSNKRISSQTG